jgi:hypothetical protein
MILCKYDIGAYDQQGKDNKKLGVDGDAWQKILFHNDKVYSEKIIV